MIPIFPCSSRRSKGVPSGSEVFIRLLVGELGTPKLSQIFAYGKWLYPYTVWYTARQIWTKDVWKRVDRRTLHFRGFPPNIFASTPNIAQKYPFWGTFQCKTYYRLLRTSGTLMELRSWKFTVMHRQVLVRLSIFFR